MFVSRGVPGETREAVRALLEAGLSRAAVARELGITRPTVTHHARALGLPVDSRCNRRYDWGEVQAYYDEGHSITACQLHFGFARKTFADPSNVARSPHVDMASRSRHT
jgi:transposase-like protein